MRITPTLPLIPWAESVLGQHGYRKVGPNTWLYYDRATGEYRLKLHDTDVVAILTDTSVRLAHGGWHTRVTADRMDAFARLLGVRVGWSHGRIVMTVQDELPVAMGESVVVERRVEPERTGIASA